MPHTERPELAEIEEHVHPEVTDDPRWLHLVALASTLLNRLAAAVAATCLVAMTALILVEICLRFFSRSTFMADALVGYGVAAITFLAAAWALEEGAMIRVTVLTDRMAPRLRRITEGFALISVGTILWFLMSYQWRMVDRLWTRGTVSQHFFPIPLWIPETFFLVGLGLLLFQVVVRALRLVAVGHSEERALNI